MDQMTCQPETNSNSPICSPTPGVGLLVMVITLRISLISMDSISNINKLLCLACCASQGVAALWWYVPSLHPNATFFLFLSHCRKPRQLTNSFIVSQVAAPCAAFYCKATSDFKLHFSSQMSLLKPRQQLMTFIISSSGSLFQTKGISC